MEVLKNNVRLFVICVSVSMFSFQLHNALKNLIDPPQVDSSSYTKIEDIELPLITICLTNQTNLAVLKEFGYSDGLQDLLAGSVPQKQSSSRPPIKVTSNQTGWIDVQGIDNVVFIPRYGHCIELSDYDTDFDISINAHLAEDPSLRVFITDKTFRSYSSLDYSSNKGNPINIEKDEIGMYDVDIISSCNIMSRESLDSKDKYKKCVDEQIQKEIGEPLGCIPPWMSSSNHCNGTYAKNWVDSQIADFTKKFVEKPYSLQNTEIEKQCRKYCSATIASVHTREKKRTTEFESEIRIAFNQQVKVTEKIFNYGPFQFVIDVGSSVGLWLGLSVLGLYDLGFQALERFQICYLRKLASSATK